MKAGIYFKKGVGVARDLSIKIAEMISSRGWDVFFDSEFAGEIDMSRFKISDLRDLDLDFIVVVGGDGTLIKLLHKLGERSIPIMTVRMGRRGVLLDVSPIEVESRLEDLFNGRYVIRSYERIYAEIEDRSIRTPPAINEILVTPSVEYIRSRVLRCTVYKDDALIYSLEGDGVIVSTSIGSTAYSLAAGGPLVDHSLPVMVITPLLPINLWVRPVVLPIDSIVRIMVRKDSIPAEIVIDGSVKIPIAPGESVKISKYPHPVRIIRFHRDESIYEKIFERR
ncbi:MAG: NAD(+)/NADH kinase [Sulfolobales archaeon]